jgi:hypothetical protein
MLMGMRIAMGVGAQVIGEAVRPQDIVDEVVRAEADGFGSAWSVHFRAAWPSRAPKPRSKPSCGGWPTSA